MQPDASAPRIPDSIRRFLDRYDRRARLVATLRGLGVSLGVIAGLVALALALDRWLILDVPARVVITASALVGGVVTLSRAVIAPLVARRPVVHLARAVEAARPTLDEALLTVCELAGEPDARVSPELLAALEEHTGDRLRRIEPTALIDSRPARRALALGASVALVVTGVLLAHPEASRLLLHRLVRPTSDLPRPTTVVMRVEPGDAIAGQGAAIDVRAMAIEGDPLGAELEWREPGTGAWRRAAMRIERRRGSRSASPARFAHTLASLERSLEYRVRAGDYLGETFRIEVKSRPRTVEFRMTLTYPEYTGREPETRTSSSGRVAAVRGTAVEIAARADRSLRAAAVQIDGEDTEPRALAVDGERFGFSTVLRRSTRFRLFLEDTDGIESASTGPHALVALDDAPPRLRLIEPTGQEVSIEPGRPLWIRVEGRDDIGVLSLRVEVETAAGLARAIDMPLDGSDVTAFARRHSLDLGALELRQGETARFEVVAEDGLGQQTRTPSVALRVEFLPDPPEGGEWYARLGEIDGELERAARDWNAILSGVGDPQATELTADPARIELMRSIAAEVPRHADGWMQIAALLETLGGTVTLPSVQRRGLSLIARRLRLAAGESALELRGAALATAAAMVTAIDPETLSDPSSRPPASQSRARPLEEGGPAVSASRLRTAFSATRDELAAVRDVFTIVHRFERLENAADTLRTLVELEREVLATLGDTGGEASASARRLQLAIRGESRALIDELLSVGRLGSRADRALEMRAEYFEDVVAPRIDVALRELDGGRRPDALLAVERVIESLDGETGAITREVSHREQPLLDALSSLEPAEGIAARIGEAAASLAAAGPDATAALASLRASLQQIRFEISEARRHRPPDYPSVIDLADLAQVIGVLVDDSPAALPPPVELAAFLEELARVVEPIEIGARLGVLARDARELAAAADSVRWSLGETRETRRRRLRVLARALDELRRVARRGSDAATALDADAASALASCAPACDRAAAAVRDGRIDVALAALLEVVGSATDAALSADAARESRRAELDRARVWLRARLGSFSERAARLASRQRGVAAAVAALEPARDPSNDSTKSTAQNSTQNTTWDTMHETITSAREEQGALRAGALGLGRMLTLEGSRLIVSGGALSPEDALDQARELDEVAASLGQIAGGVMADTARWLESAAHAGESATRERILADATRFATEAADALDGLVARLRLIETREALELAGNALATLDDAVQIDWNDPQALAMLIERATRSLEAARRARDHLEGVLADGPSRARLLESLRAAAVSFEAALGVARAGDGPEARRLLSEGEAAFRAVIALVRRLRGETERSLAESRADEDEDGSSPRGERTPELDRIHQELRRLQELRGWQARLEAQLAELLEDPSRATADDLSELAELQRRLAETLGDAVPGGGRLIELAATLLSGDETVERLAGEQAAVGEDARDLDATDEDASLLERQRRLIDDAVKATDEVLLAGSKLAIALPPVLEPFWSAQLRVEPALELMRGVEGALARSERAAAGESAGRAAGELRALGELLDTVRTRALEEIADRQSRAAAADPSSTSLEMASASTARAAEELEAGNLRGAQRFQRSAARGMMAGVDSVRAYLERMRRDTVDEGTLLSRVLDGAEAGRDGLAWSVSARRSVRDPIVEREEHGARALSAAFPEEFRELVRIYLKALLGEE